MISYHKHSVWPIKTSDEGDSFAGYFYINVNKKPWSIFETFSPKPKLHRLPLKHRISDFKIQQYLTQDEPEYNLIELLNDRMRLHAIKVLSQRFGECHKGGRHYEASRYWTSNAVDTSMDFITQAHWDQLEKEAKYRTLLPQDFLAKLLLEDHHIVRIEDTNEYRSSKKDRDIPLMHEGIIDNINKRRAEAQERKLNPNKFTASSPQPPQPAPRVTQDPEEFAKMQARLDAMDDIND